MAKTKGDMFLDLFENTINRTRIEDAMYIGIVVNMSPIRIKIGELILEEEDFTINPYLLPWREYCDGLTKEGGYPTHTHGMVYLDHPCKFKLGSEVTCYGMNWDDSGKTYQNYLVLEVIKI